MAGPVPILLQETLNLQNLNINPQFISFTNLTLESDKYICIREQVGEQSNVVIIDLAQPQNPLRRPMKAESALMNPARQIIALRAAGTLQIFNIEARQKMKSFAISDNIVYWKWITGSTLALVTGTGVFHWSMEGTSDPVKMFDRHPTLASSQIINYRIDPTGQWLLLVGIKQEEGGRIGGQMQLYSVEKKQSQPIEGHAAAFCQFKAAGMKEPYLLFCFAVKSATSSKFHVVEVGSDKRPADMPAFGKKSCDMNYPPEAAQDFPVAMQVAERYGIVFVVTRFGFCYLFELETCTQLYWNRICTDTMFVTTPHEASGGLMGVTKRGQVLTVGINDGQIIPYICSALNNISLGIKIASRANLPGAENLFKEQFNRMFQQGLFKEAAQVAADAPQGVLRTPATIQLFGQVPSVPGQASPVLQYFGILLDRGKLNGYETIELARLVLSQGRVQLLDKWMKEDKLECSEDLGDIVKQSDATLALQIYLRANVPRKVIATFMETGQFDKVILYCKKINFTPDFPALLQQAVQYNPQGALQFALMLANSDGGSLVEYNTVTDIFMQRNCLQEATAFLLDVLKNNRPEEGMLQTRLLEMNLVHAPQVADAILNNKIFSHYDRAKISQLCEKAGLYQRALEHYTELADIKRCLVHTQMLQPEWLVAYFGTLRAEYALECLKELLTQKSNLRIVVEVATKYSDQLTPAALIALFESFNSQEGLYYYLGAIVNFSQDPLVHNKYIMAAARVQDIKEVERVTRESSFYDPVLIKDFLKELKLPDPRPLINVCDRHNMVDELTHYLYSNNMKQFIEFYVQKVNAVQTPAVVGALLDADCPEEFIKNLVMSVRNLCPVQPLVDEVEKRNRLKVLTTWLEQRFAEGNQEPALHNALAKIYIDTNKDPERFLTTNPFYDSLVVGKYCEKRDPTLAYVAYRRGLCDYELVEVTNKNGLFKQQARYLVERQSPELFAHCLADDNTYRRQVIDQIVQTALPECKDPKQVAGTVKAFMVADLPNELIELLEKIVLHGTQFKAIKDLQNLLVLTAIKADKTRVMDYVNKLDNYDGPDIAKIAVDSELYEEAYFIFKKFHQNVSAVKVLLFNLNSIPRALEFADRVNEPEVWSNLAKAQLEQGMVSEAIASFLKANDAAAYADVIRAAESASCFDDLVKYLLMARKKVKEASIDSELMYAYAKTNRLNELEEFVAAPNVGQIQVIGDKCFEQGLYEAAKILFTNVSNFSRLTSCLVKLGQYQAAVDAARKANSTRTWKEVCFACIESREFRLAQMCALNIIVQADELEELIVRYENLGYVEEVISVLENGLGMERAHRGMFTKLGALYAKYKPHKLMEHIKLFWQRINIPELLRVCEASQDWTEMCFLYIHSEEFDNAAMMMINHSPEAWEHAQFKDVIVKVANLEIYYKAIAFYLAEQPMILNDLLTVLKPRVDNPRVVQQLRKAGHLALIKPYLVGVQEVNVSAVNEALNELYVNEEDYDNLRDSIDRFDNFDQIALAQLVEKHELLEFRRIAAYIYKNNGRWQESVALSKHDRLFKDAMETAAQSGDQAVAEDLVRFFVQGQLYECFAACLFTCYDLLKPDVVLELAWRQGISDYAMPYFIQMLQEYTTKVDSLQKTLQEKAKEKEASSERADASPPPAVTVDAPMMVPPPGMYGAPAMLPQYDQFGNPMPVPMPGMMPGMMTASMAPQMMGSGMVPPGMMSTAIMPGSGHMQQQPMMGYSPSSPMMSQSGFHPGFAPR